MGLSRFSTAQRKGILHMTIRCRCNGCRAKFDAPQKYVGRQVKCPKCGQQFTVEAAKRRSKGGATDAAGDSAITPSVSGGTTPGSQTDSTTVPVVGSVDLVNFVPAPPEPEDSNQADIPVFPQVESPAPAAPSAPTPAVDTPASDTPASEYVQTDVPEPPPAPTGPASTASTSAGRIRPPRPAPSNAPMMFAAVLTFVASAALVVGIYYIVKQPAGGPALGNTQPKLAFVWPVATRSGAEIFINGRRMILPAKGEIEYVLQPGAYELRLSRRGFRSIESRVDLKPATIQQFEPIWEADNQAPAATPTNRRATVAATTPTRKTPAPRGFAGWMQNYEEAKTNAAAENKKLLIAFVNSSSAQPQMMVRNVFSKREFRETAGKQYVLVVIDIPESRAAFARLADPAQNERLLRQFDIVQFPTFIFADSAGAPFAFEVSTWELTDLARLDQQQAERDRLFAAVDAATDDRKHLAAVDAADFLFKNRISRYYKDRGDQWLSLAEKYDSNNTGGTLEKAFFVHWSSHIEVPEKPHRLPRLLVRFNQWKQKHTFKDPRITINFYSIAATAMLDIGNADGARNYLKEAQTLFTTNSAYQRQVKQLLAASDDIKG